MPMILEIFVVIDKVSGQCSFHCAVKAFLRIMMLPRSEGQRAGVNRGPVILSHM